MSYCSNCGYKFEGKENFCPSCGVKIEKKKQKKKNNEESINEEKTKKVISNETKEKIKQFLDVKDISEEFSKEEVEDNKLLGVLSYCGVFALIPYFSNRKSKYVEFHSIQGMNLLITMICYIITYSLLSLIKVTRYVIDWGYMVGSKKVTPLWITLPMAFIGILIFIIMIYGIINACNGKSKTLPIINKIKVIK